MRRKKTFAFFGLLFSVLSSNQTERDGWNFILILCFCFSWVVIRLVLMQREYFKQGKIDQFRQILEEGSSPGIYSALIWCFDNDVG